MDIRRPEELEQGDQEWKVLVSPDVVYRPPCPYEWISGGRKKGGKATGIGRF
jgi:hypothetical protein